MNPVSRVFSIKASSEKFQLDLIEEAIKNGNIEEIERLLPCSEKKVLVVPDWLSKPLPEAKLLPLSYAVECKQYEIAKLLFEYYRLSGTSHDEKFRLSSPPPTVLLPEEEKQTFCFAVVNAILSQGGWTSDNSNVAFLFTLLLEIPDLKGTVDNFYNAVVNQLVSKESIPRQQIPLLLYKLGLGLLPLLYFYPLAHPILKMMRATITTAMIGKSLFEGIKACWQHRHHSSWKAIAVAAGVRGINLAYRLRFFTRQPQQQEAAPSAAPQQENLLFDPRFSCEENKKAFLELVKKIHPDRFANSSEGTKHTSEQLTMLLLETYKKTCPK